MADETRRILFDEPQILAVAIGVALVVAALLAILSFCIFRKPAIGVWSGLGASLFAVPAVIWGDLAFTRWALYDGGHGRPPGMAPLSDWIAFACVNAVLAAGAGIPGAILGAICGRANAKRGK
jgi:hypothetical protein